MSITTRGWGGGPITSSGWGGLGAGILRRGVKNFILFIQRVLEKDQRIVKKVNFDLFIQRSESFDLRIEQSREFDLFIEREKEFTLIVDPKKVRKKNGDS